MILDFPAPDLELQALGRRLARLRDERHVSREVLAQRLDVAEQDLEKAERGRLRLSAVQLYAATLHLHIPMRLLFEDGPATTLHQRAAPPPRAAPPH